MVDGDEEDVDLVWLGNFLEHYDHHYDEDDDDNVEQETVRATYGQEELAKVIARIGSSAENSLIGLRERKLLIKANMGTIGLCQVNWRGETLRELGAIEALLNAIAEVKLGRRASEARTEYEKVALELEITCWQALRNMACGSAGNRTAIREYQNQTGLNGLQLMAASLETYDKIPWIDMNGLELELVTAVIGALRNVTHKTPENCQPCHELGVSSLLIWRLVHASGSPPTCSLPDQSQPWREVCFRAAGTLINIAEEYRPCLEQCSSNACLISILIESWGTNKRLVGMFRSLLQSARTILPPGEYMEPWDDMIR